MSFPPEAKTCLHCGGPLGGATIFNLARGANPPIGRDGPVQMPDEEPGKRGGFRLGMGGIWLLFAVLATLQRVCSGG